MAIKNNDPSLVELMVTESTNNYAMALIHEGLAQHGKSVLAYHQTGGKGQRGKIWQSPAGESMSLSVILQPSFVKPSQGFQLLATIAVAVTTVLEKYIGDETSIKWPNDLYWRDRKAGGILIESIIKGTDYVWVVAGIGINVKQSSFPQFLGNPVSLKQITGKEVDIKKLALEISEEVIASVDSLKQNGADAVFEKYNAKLFLKNQLTKLKHNTRVFETRIKGVNNQGQLITGEHSENCFNFGEVEWKH